MRRLYPYQGDNMTVKLYDNNAYIKEFEAQVVSCENYKDGYAVVLDKTAFFPEGGGQQADTGTLGDVNVLDVQEKDNIIIHYTDKELNAGESVRGKLNWEQRFSRMQSHTGEHLVSGLLHTMYGYNNVGFHMSKESLTIDTSGLLSDDDISRLELCANKAIYENRKVTACYPDADTLKSTDYRSKLDLESGVRLVTIDSYDVCACCAPHVHHTGEIGIIKIISAIQYKGGTRLEVACGINAFNDYRKLHDDNKEMMHLLSASRDKVLEFVVKDHDTIGLQKAQINALNAQLASANLSTQIIGNTLCGFTKGATFDDMRALVNDNLDKAQLCAFFSETDENEYSYVIASEVQDVRDLVKELNTTFNGKGGGRPQYAQGKISADKSSVADFFKNK